MSRLEELIAELCPDGVEYKELGDVCSVITKQTGFDYTNTIKSRLIREHHPNSIPYIQTKFFTHRNIDYNTDYFVPMDIVNQFPKITLDEKCILFSIVGASIGNVGLFPGVKKCFLGGAICVAKVLPEYNIDYIYYCVESHHIQKQIRKKEKGAGQATITIADIRKFKIPVPPLEIQSEIVRILDVFGELKANLTAELNAELKAREVQFQEYLKKQYDFDSSIPVVSINDVCKKISSGGTPTSTNKDYYGGNIPWLRTQEIDWKNICETSEKITDEGLKNSSAKWIPENCVIVAMYGATAAKTAINMIPLTTNQACCNLQIDDTKALYKYVYYWLCKEYLNLKALGQGSQHNLNAGQIKSYKIPLPTLDKQKQIVCKLDNFHKLCSSITSVLPAEIEGREKQYEYYRDLLLTFKPKVTA